ncbi:MAG: NAD-dependent epimerase/dehydratase family protein [Patescibacteria group bacterium]
MELWEYRGKRVLVTGGCGFIGSNLVHRLVQLGADVVVLDSFLPGGGANRHNLDGLGKKVRIVKTDLASPAAAKHINADFIFHLAAQTGHKESLLRPFEDMDANVTATLRLLEAARQNCPDAVIVYAGTRDQYGRIQKNPVDENHPLLPTDPNCISKHAAEQYCLLYHRNHDLKSVSLRLTNIYGPRSQIRTSVQGFIGWFVNLALKGEEIAIFGDGKQLRDVLYVDDAVEAMLLAGVTKEAYGEAFNIASGKGVPLIDIAKTIVREAGSGTIKHAPFPAENRKIEIGDFVGDIRKAERFLKWKPRVSLADGMRQTTAFYRTRMKEYG